MSNHGAVDGGSIGQKPQKRTQEKPWRRHSNTRLVQQTSHTNVCLSAVRLKSVSVFYYDLAAEWFLSSEDEEENKSQPLPLHTISRLYMTSTASDFHCSSGCTSVPRNGDKMKFAQPIHDTHGCFLHAIVTDSSSRLTYLQLHVGTGMTGFVRRSAATSAMSMCLPLIAWTNSTIAEMAWEMTCLSVELHALTIDYSSVRGLDLGFEWWQCIQQLLTQASTIGEKKPYFP